MLLQGEIECERCKSLIKWEYNVPMPLSKICVEKLSKDRQRPLEVVKLENDTYVMQLFCRNCGANITVHYPNDNKS